MIGEAWHAHALVESRRRRAIEEAIDIEAERVVVGAIAARRLHAADVADCGGAFWYRHHAAIAELLVALLEIEAEGRKLPGGLLRATLIAARLRGLSPVGGLVVVNGRTIAAGYLPTLARRAPGRREALRAVRRVEDLAEERRLVEVRIERAERGMVRALGRATRRLEQLLGCATGGG